MANGQSVPLIPGSEFDELSISTLPKWDGWIDLYALLMAFAFSAVIYSIRIY